MSVTIQIPMEVRMHLLKRALQGANYPTNTGDLVEVAELNFASDIVIDMITDLGDSQYFSFLDVAQEIMYRRRNEGDSADDVEDEDDDEDALYSSEFDFLDLRKEYF